MLGGEKVWGLHPIAASVLIGCWSQSLTGPDAASARGGRFVYDEVMVVPLLVEVVSLLLLFQCNRRQIGSAHG